MNKEKIGNNLIILSTYNKCYIENEHNILSIIDKKSIITVYI